MTARPGLGVSRGRFQGITALYDKANPDKVIYVGNKEVGDFMTKKVFEPGRTLTWNELTRFATGAYLSPEAFARDFRGK